MYHYCLWLIFFTYFEHFPRVLVPSILLLRVDYPVFPLLNVCHLENSSFPTCSQWYIEILQSISIFPLVHFVLFDFFCVWSAIKIYIRYIVSMKSLKHCSYSSLSGEKEIKFCTRLSPGRRDNNRPIRDCTTEKPNI